MQLNRILQPTIQNSLMSKFKRERKDVMVAEIKKKLGVLGKGGRPKKRLVTDDFSVEDENGQLLPAAKTTRSEVSINH